MRCFPIRLFVSTSQVRCSELTSRAVAGETRPEDATPLEATVAALAALRTSGAERWPGAARTAEAAGTMLQVATALSQPGQWRVGGGERTQSEIDGEAAAGRRLLIVCVDETEGGTLAAATAARLIHVPTLNVCDAPAHALRDGELASWLSSPSTRIGRTEKSSDVLLAQAEGSDEQPARWVQRLLAQVAGCPLEK